MKGKPEKGKMQNQLIFPSFLQQVSIVNPIYLQLINQLVEETHVFLWWRRCWLWEDDGFANEILLTSAVSSASIFPKRNWVCPTKKKNLASKLACKLSTSYFGKIESLMYQKWHHFFLLNDLFFQETEVI